MRILALLLLGACTCAVPAAGDPPIRLGECPVAGQIVGDKCFDVLACPDTGALVFMPKECPAPEPDAAPAAEKPQKLI